MSYKTKAKPPTAYWQEAYNQNSAMSSLGIMQAAWRLEDVRAGCRPERYDSGAGDEEEEHEEKPFIYPDDQQARTDFFRVLKWQKYYARAIHGMIFLTLIEIPTWCNSDGWFEWKSPQERCCLPKIGCETENFNFFYLSGIPYLPRGITYSFETFLIIILAIKLFFEYNLQVKYFDKFSSVQAPYFYVKRIKLCGLMLVLELLDMLLSMACAAGIADNLLFPWESNRYSFVPRSGLLFMLPSVLTLGACIKNILPEMQTVAIFFVGFMIFFSWLTFQVVKSMDDDDTFPVAKELPEYATVGSCFFSLYVAGICDEFVDVMLSAYGKQRFLGILFFGYLLVVHLLFLSLVLDTLCAGYMKQTEEEEHKGIDQKAKGLVQTYKDLVAATGDVGHGHGGHEGATGSLHSMRCSREGFLAFIKELNRSPENRNTKDEDAKVIFAAMQKEDKLEAVDFAETCTLLDFKFSTAWKYSKLKDVAPEPIVDLVDGSDTETGRLNYIMTNVLILNLIFIIVESYYDLKAGWLGYKVDVDEPPFLDWMEYVFGIIYLSECTIKILIHGWGRYLAKPANVFDLFTTALLLTTQLLEDLVLPQLDAEAKSAGGNSNLSNLNLSTYANLLRLFRLVRLIKQAKNLSLVQFMVDTVAKLVVKAKDMLTLLFVAVFTFTMLSVQLWGGKMYPDNPLLDEAAKQLEKEKEEIDWLEEKEYALNTNDTAVAFGFWFVMLLCEFKLSYVDLVWYITEKSWWQWMILVVFWVVSVCITFELVKAFTIEVYMDLQGKYQEREKKKAEAKKELAKLKEQQLAVGFDLVEAEQEQGEDPEEGGGGEREGLFKAIDKLKRHYDGKKPRPLKFFAGDRRPDDTESKEIIEEIEKIVEGKQGHGHGGHGHGGGHGEGHGHGEEGHGGHGGGHGQEGHGGGHGHEEHH